MKLVFSQKPLHKELGVLLVSKGKLQKALSEYGEQKKLFEREKFEGKENQTLFLVNGLNGFDRFLFAGVSEKQATAEKVRIAAATAIKYAQALKTKKISFLEPLTELPDKLLVSRAIVEASVLADYSFQKYKTNKDEKKVFVESLELAGEFSETQKKELYNALLACGNANLVRDLVNDNSALVTPAFLETHARAIAKKTGLKIKVFQEKELEKMKMGCFLSVGQAGTTPPRMVVLEHNGNPSSKEKIVLVGKGICFDTGGLDLKPGTGMETMRQDMAGAATVLGIMKTASELGLKKNLVGIMGLAENLIGEKSYRQGDVLTSMKGLTVENNSTDAEGRLVLADCLYYGAKTFNPKLIVSIATLTGNIRVCLGTHMAGFTSTDEKMAKEIISAAEATGEMVWRMPLTENYLAEVKTSQRADLRSLNKARTNGMIYGAAFLSNFVEEKPFLHLDIAGTAFLEETPKPYLELGATGFGMRLLTEMLKN